MKVESSTLAEVFRIGKFPLYVNLKAVDGAEQWQFCLEDTSLLRNILLSSPKEPYNCLCCLLT